MAALRNAAGNRAMAIFLIAFLIVVHLLLVHGHDEASAFEACVVLLVPAALALVAVALPANRSAARSATVVASVVDWPWEVRRPLPALIGTVMRH